MGDLVVGLAIAGFMLLAMLGALVAALHQEQERRNRPPCPRCGSRHSAPAKKARRRCQECGYLWVP